MDITTDDKLTQEKEQFARDTIETVTRPAVEAAVTPQVDRLVAMIEGLAGKYATHEEVDAISANIRALGDGLNTRLEEHHLELKTQEEQRHRQFNERIVQIHGQVIDNEQRIAVVEAASKERIGQIEKRLTKVEDDIKSGVAAVARHASTIDRTITRWLDESKIKEDKYNLELLALQNAKVQFEKEIRDNRDDTGSIRADVEGLRGDLGASVRPMQDTVRDLKPRVSQLEAQSAQAALVLDKIEWVAGGVRWLFKERGGNIVLGLILAALIGFQIYYAVLSYNLNQKYNELIPIIVALQSALK